MYHIWILNEIFCFWSVMCFLAACSTECFAILADTLRVTFCYGSSEKRLVNQSRPILFENEIDYFDTTTIKEALCNSQCSNTQNNVANYRETDWSRNSQKSEQRELCVRKRTISTSQRIKKLQTTPFTRHARFLKATQQRLTRTVTSRS